jgi:oligopeptide/dipeptide ABC transporter ATP-binding protein
MVMYAGRIVEEATVEGLFRTPGHPYSQALLGSLPTITEDRGRRLDSIAGRPPSPTSPEEGCPFVPRCPLARPSCSSALPPLIARAGGSFHRCPVAEEEALSVRA